MIRCPRCGHRLAIAGAVCAQHGAVEVVESPELLADDVPPTAAFEALGYRLHEQLGRGGYGVVYAAERLSDGQSVAVKLVAAQRAGDGSAFEREVALLRAVGTPHAPEVYAAGKLDGFSYVVLERLRMPTLAQRMVAWTAPPGLDELGRVARSILAAVEAVHEHGVVHRDLKPENIFVPDHGAARLIDFGLAQLRDKRSQATPQADADDAGTAEYMSPEQCNGIVDGDIRSDIYGLGVIFYEMLSGAPPFWGRAAEVREAHRSRRPAPLALKVTCPPDLDKVVRRCLAKSRDQRFPHIRALRDALEHALQTRLPSAGPRAREVTEAAARPAASNAREKRSVGLVFFESRAGLRAVQAPIVAAGGQIVQTAGTQYVAAFGHDIGDNPARVAVNVARRLVAGGHALRLLVDVATVSVQVRPDGSRRIFSPLLSRADRFPTAADPEGVMLTAASAAVLGDLEPQALAERPERFMLPVRQGHNELTTLGVEVGPLLGREGEVARLLNSARRAAQEGRPTLATVAAAAGYGRTHLAGLVARELSHDAARFELIRLSMVDGAVASQATRELLQVLLRLPSLQAPSEADFEGLKSALGSLGEGTCAAVGYTLGWLDNEHPDVKRILSAPGALRHTLARALGELLRRWARVAPLALIVDDAQLADDATLDAIEYATLPGEGVRLWACVLVRPSFLGSRPSWNSRAAASERITLGALGQKPAIELARALLLPAEHIPESALQRLVDRTQGVPRLLVELARGLIRDGYVRRAARGGAYYLATDELDKLPDLPIVQWNAIREIEALPDELAAHARLASVLGVGFRVAELEALQSVLERDAGSDETQLDAAVGVQRLCDSGLLVRQRTGGYGFRHALLRDTVYQLLPETQRERLHRAAFEAYKTLNLPQEQRLPRLALHAARCGQRAFAAATYLELAHRHAKAQAYLEAEAAYSQALSNLEDSEHAALIETCRGRGRMRSRLGRQEAALGDLRRARELAHAGGDGVQELELMLDEATVLDWMREADQSRMLVEGVARSNRALSPLLQAQLAMGLARSYHRRGEMELSIQRGNEAVQLAEALGDEAYETRVISLLMLATNYAYSARLAPAQECFERVIEEASSRGDIWHVAAAHANRAALWHGLRDIERVRADLTRTVQLSREIGEASLEWVAVYNLGESEYVMDQLERAREHAQRAFELATQLFGEGNREVSGSQLLLARIALYAADLPAAAEHVRQILDRVARGEAAGEQDTTLEGAQHVQLRMVELSLEQAPEAAWHELLERARALEMQPMEEVELIERAALEALHEGEFERGRALYAQARSVCEQKPNLLSERLEARLLPLFAAAT